ncbi:hypothetical protein BJ878DRAFT_36336 [Calycina marina]|uniref:DUF3074 domain-containing protein n=1 Tax=Calycina marina TaxID=1763456 RepID=A0A9P7ZB39_9HELO|nr:hypothetical protein BJ878DRAFT_36336 [Calycina marina]
MAEILGPYVRLEGIGIGQLPFGGKGIEPSIPIPSNEKSSDGSGSVAAPNIKAFITRVLSEAAPFIDGVAQKSDGTTASTWKMKGAPKSFPHSDAPVHSFERIVSGKTLDGIEGMSQFSADRKDETWLCRKSTHSNLAQPNTASWAEFRHSFKNQHIESEDAFTADIIGARKAIIYDTAGLSLSIDNQTWTHITLVVVESIHKIPKPLKNRAFPVVQIAADLGENEFVVVSIPLTNFEKSPYAEYARSKSVVIASYVSVERIRILPETGEIEWLMATASNAKGVLPPWVQKLAMHSAITKDVDMFLAWIPTQRSGYMKPETVTKSKEAKSEKASKSANVACITSSSRAG